jgi:Ca-activated chloride channel family protein
MTLFRNLNSLDYLFITIFILLYLLYCWRMYRIAVALHSSIKKLLIKIILRSSYFVLLLIALLGPSFGEVQKEVKSIGKDIYVAIDLSQSMDAIDIQPSRLEKIKYELKNLVAAFSSDRIGLIIFSSEAFVQCPLTYDQSALNLFIETLNTGLVPSTSTDFAAPLRMILKKFTDDAEKNNDNKPATRVMLMISDGEDFGDDTDDFTANMKTASIKVFTLGVGTSEGGKIPFRKSFKRDATGREVITKMESEKLREIATVTGGQYFELSNNKNEVQNLITTIKRIKGELRDTRKIDVTQNKYHYFLFAAFLLILLDVFFTVKTLKIA